MVCRIERSPFSHRDVEVIADDGRDHVHDVVPVATEPREVHQALADWAAWAAGAVDVLDAGDGATVERQTRETLTVAVRPARAGPAPVGLVTDRSRTDLLVPQSDGTILCRHAGCGPRVCTRSTDDRRMKDPRSR